MKATIRDSSVLMSMGPLAVATYLRSKNWRQVEVIGDKGSVWMLHSDDRQEFEILLPSNRGLRDFASRMSDVLQTLEVVESHESNEPRSQLDILTDITNATSDLLRIRLASANVENGTLPIEQGVRVVEHARDLLLAAACATVEPRALYETKKAAQAVDYLRQVRIGQTERGSFVLIIQSEVPPRLAFQDQPALLEIEEPFERRVMLTLAGALTAARNAAQHAGATGNWQPFTDAVREGVSANLCEAIAGLAEDGGPDSVAMSFSWAPGRALLHQAPERVLVSPEMIPVLREGARIFRGSAPLEDFELRGEVSRSVESELRQQLERVQEKHNKAQGAAVQLLEINRLKSEFIVNAGHEIEASLQSVLGLAELLERGSYGILTEEQRKAVQAIYGWARRIKSDVDWLIEYGSTRSRRLESRHGG
jgi:signal transduction histidine kinase